MLTVAILINGQPIMARSVVNTGQYDDEGRTLYQCDDGTMLAHREADGAVPLAIAALGTIKEQRTRRKRGRQTET